MRVRKRSSLLLTLAACAAPVFTSIASIGAQAPGLDPSLQAAASYVAAYERDVTAVVAQETYTQRIIAEGRIRRLKSDLVIVAEPSGGWVEFRDVYEVDDRPVRDRDERIVRLFMQPSSDRHAQARQIVEESARFNISPQRAAFSRTINVPLTALRFLRSQNQSRSTWEVSSARVDGRDLVMLRFKERAVPRLIGSNEGTPATGAFWIDPSLGVIVKSELAMSHERIVANIVVQYARNEKLNLWLPDSMDESYNIRVGRVGRVDGRALYSNYRQFTVETSTSVK